MIYRPLSVQFEITEACTHKCKHCYNYYGHTSNPSSTNKKVIAAITNQEFFDITLTGGEPLCDKEKFYESIERFKKENMDVRLNSNLHLLTKEDAKKIVEFGVDSVLSSILGSSKETHDSISGVNGSFEKLSKSLGYFAENGFGVAMNMVVNKRNLSDVYDTARLLLEKFGVEYFCATPMVISPGKDLEDISLSRSEYIQTLDTLLLLQEDLGIKVDSLHPAVPCMFPEEEQERYRKFFEERACAAAQGTLTFSPKGDVRACSHEIQIYGNILQDSLEDILKSMENWKNGTFIPIECSPCEYVNLCRGGCRVSAEANSGDLKGLEPYYTHPIRKNILQKEEKIEFERLKVKEGKIRQRDEEKGLTTVYISPKINTVLTPIELSIFRRFVFGKDYNEILKEVKNEKILRDTCTKLARRKLLINP